VPLFGGLPFPIQYLSARCRPVCGGVALAAYNKTKIGKIARAAAVDREMVGAVGINVSWVLPLSLLLMLPGGLGVCLCTDCECHAWYGP
jgi:branched-subunit amino acid ABC-type transport system permease component